MKKHIKLTETQATCSDLTCGKSPSYIVYVRAKVFNYIHLFKYVSNQQWYIM